MRAFPQSAAATSFCEAEAPDSLDGEYPLDTSVDAARDALIAQQHADGFWCFELEADCTIPAEYILTMHFMGEIDRKLQAKLAAYLRLHQGGDGGWPLFFDGDFDISCSVKVYYALKLAGDDPDAPHMVRAREAILAHGGAAGANVFTRITLALFGQVPWRATPFMPVEILLLPRWFPFHLSKVSYWSRTVMVPLLILCSLRAQARNPQDVHIPELFAIPAEKVRHYFPVRSRLNRILFGVERIVRLAEPLIPRWVRQRALAKAEAWFVERLNGDSGLGAIFPAMVNAYEALDCLGFARDHPYPVAAKQALRALVVDKGDHAYCQPCYSPVWDTALACLALQETGGDAADAAVARALEWLLGKQLRDSPGDWRDQRPSLRGGGWPFQFQNDYYPDLDDTGAVGWAMAQAGNSRYGLSLRRAAEWIRGMQSANGGFASFDVDNCYFYLNEIPFADHGALLDPPTADVSARCLAILSLTEKAGGRYREAVEACIAYLRAEQEPDGSWFGRWGTNYIYGTWSVLTALEIAGIDPSDSSIRRAASWLERVQRPSGGWGEDNRTYWDQGQAGCARAGTSFQTAWALLGSMAAGEAGANSVRRGVDFLLRRQQSDGLWDDDSFTAPGFPRVFFLKYHGYSKFFPLWALARYRNLRRGLSL